MPNPNSTTPKRKRLTPAQRRRAIARGIITPTAASIAAKKRNGEMARMHFTHLIQTDAARLADQRDDENPSIETRIDQAYGDMLIMSGLRGGG